MSKSTPRVQFLEDNLRAKNWHGFLNRVCYSTAFTPTFTNVIWSTIPPTYIRSDDDQWEYLRDIAAGFYLIPGCGLVCRGKLAQFLRENDPDNIQEQRSTCPDCGADIPNDGCCWYCENHPSEAN